MIEQILKLTRDYFGGSLYLGDALDFATRVVELKPEVTVSPSGTVFDSIPALDVARIAQQVGAGRNIQAIKILREVSGLGLKPAKDAVDQLRAELDARDGTTDPVCRRSHNDGNSYPF